MSAPVSRPTVGGKPLMRFFNGSIVRSAVVGALCFLLMWPKTVQEAFIRIACTVAMSTMLGPFLVVALHSWWPSLFESAKELAVQVGAPPMFGLLFLAAPIMVLAGLPAWWVLGAIERWLDQRRNKDIGEIAADARQISENVEA